MREELIYVFPLDNNVVSEMKDEYDGLKDLVVRFNKSSRHKVG